MILAWALVAWGWAGSQAQETCGEAVARCSALRGDATQAMGCIDGVVQKFPNCAEAHALRTELGNIMGYAAKQGGNEQGMTPYFQKTLESAARLEQLEPRNPAFALDRAHAAYETGQLDEAYKSYTKTLGLAKDNELIASARAGRGCVLSHYGKFDEALREMELAMQASPNPQTLITRAEVFTRMGDKDKARADYDQALSMIDQPPEYKAWVQKNRDALGSGGGGLSRRNLKAPRGTAAAVRPGDSRRPGGAGETPGGQAAGREGQRGQGLKGSPACMAAVKECYALNKEGKLKEALECSGRATQAHASCAPAHFQRGWLWGNQAEKDSRKKRAQSARGGWESAKAAYARAVELDGGDALSIINRGMAEYRLGSFDEAVESLTKGISLAGKPETVAIGHFDRALAYAKQGEHEKALKDYDAAFAHFKKPSVERAETYAALGRGAEAKREYDLVIQQGSDPHAVARAKAGLKALGP